MIFDFDLDFLRDAEELVDGRLSVLDEKVKESPDPDSFGAFDEIEYITGFGFVACQTYLTATIGRSGLAKKNTLELGPKHRTGNSFAALTNACANYWKHSAEWGEEPFRNDTKKTVATIASLGVDTSNYYPLANALYELTAPNTARFASVLPFLIQWRDEVLNEKAV